MRGEEGQRGIKYFAVTKQEPKEIKHDGQFKFITLKAYDFSVNVTSIDIILTTFLLFFVSLV